MTTPFDRELADRAIAITTAILGRESAEERVFAAQTSRLRASTPEEIAVAQQVEAAARGAWKAAQDVECRARVAYTELALRRDAWLRAESAPRPQPSDR